MRVAVSQLLLTARVSKQARVPACAGGGDPQERACPTVGQATDWRFCTGRTAGEGPNTLDAVPTGGAAAGEPAAPAPPRRAALARLGRRIALEVVQRRLAHAAHRQCMAWMVGLEHAARQRSRAALGARGGTSPQRTRWQQRWPCPRRRPSRERWSVALSVQRTPALTVCAQNG